MTTRDDNGSIGAGCVMMVAFVLCLVVCGSIAGITDPVGATRTLAAQGYTNVRMTGYRWFAGGGSDWYHTGFEATSQTGQEVSGVVTSGLFFKGHTVRLD